METGLCGFDEVDIPEMPVGEDVTFEQGFKTGLDRIIVGANADAQMIIAHAMRYGFSDEELFDITKFDPWFLARIREIIQQEVKLALNGLPKTEPQMRTLKMMGFSDARRAKPRLKCASYAKALAWLPASSG